MTDFEDDRVRASFGAVKYARLAEIKAKYHPDNIFHQNANIKSRSELNHPWRSEAMPLQVRHLAQWAQSTEY